MKHAFNLVSFFHTTIISQHASVSPMYITVRLLSFFLKIMRFNMRMSLLLQAQNLMQQSGLLGQTLAAYLKVSLRAVVSYLSLRKPCLYSLHDISPVLSIQLGKVFKAPVLLFLIRALY